MAEAHEDLAVRSSGTGSGANGATAGRGGAGMAAFTAFAPMSHLRVAIRSLRDGVPDDAGHC
jgi:hypothetical protein